MAGLIPKYESITGADCTGIDGAVSRTYTLTNANYDSVIDFIKGTSSLQLTTDFTITNGVVLFIGAVNNTDVFSLRYFTTDTSTSIVAGYGYCSTADVYMTSGITSTEVSTADVNAQIARAETIICRLTKTIYWNVVKDTQVASAGTDNTITENSAGWTTNEFAGMYVNITDNTGVGQYRKIVSNTTDTLTVDRNWATNPAASSVFRIFYVPRDFNPYQSKKLDGNGRNALFLPKYPIKAVESLVIGESSPVTVDPTNLYLYETTGKIQLKQSAGIGVFSNVYPQEVDIKYWYGLDEVPYDVKRLVELHAAMQIMSQQMGGTFDDPSSISLPEATVSVGQAYINIKSSLETLRQEYTELLTTVKIWPQFA